MHCIENSESMNRVLHIRMISVLKFPLPSHDLGLRSRLIKEIGSPSVASTHVHGEAGIRTLEDAHRDLNGITATKTVGYGQTDIKCARCCKGMCWILKLRIVCCSG